MRKETQLIKLRFTDEEAAIHTKMVENDNITGFFLQKENYRLIQVEK